MAKSTENESYGDEEGDGNESDRGTHAHATEEEEEETFNGDTNGHESQFEYQWVLR